jgi:hypothetical protein
VVEVDMVTLLTLDGVEDVDYVPSDSPPVPVGGR